MYGPSIVSGNVLRQDMLTYPSASVYVVSSRVEHAVRVSKSSSNQPMVLSNVTLASSSLNSAQWR